uniref:Uncharacterized protein n=1 Tax=Physcomitrium patens TaxID=3218 RepID=A0A2K1L2R0_PHYPA|nr:hypothetical protein PHYPA_003111 [Physcomitrium patens]
MLLQEIALRSILCTPLCVFHFPPSLLGNVLCSPKSFIREAKKVGFAPAKAILGKSRKLPKGPKIAASLFALRGKRAEKKM